MLLIALDIRSLIGIDVALEFDVLLLPLALWLGKRHGRAATLAMATALLLALSLASLDLWHSLDLDWITAIGRLDITLLALFLSALAAEPARLLAWARALPSNILYLAFFALCPLAIIGEDVLVWNGQALWLGGALLAGFLALAPRRFLAFALGFGLLGSLGQASGFSVVESNLSSAFYDHDLAMARSALLAFYLGGFLRRRGDFPAAAARTGGAKAAAGAAAHPVEAHPVEAWLDRLWLLPAGLEKQPLTAHLPRKLLSLSVFSALFTLIFFAPSWKWPGLPGELELLPQISLFLLLPLAFISSFAELWRNAISPSFFFEKLGIPRLRVEVNGSEV